MAERSLQRWLFLFAVPVTFWLTWAAWRGPPPEPIHTTPDAIIRSATTVEIAAVLETARRLTTHIQTAQKVYGRNIEIGELEGMDEQGKPFIPIPIPDNPLVAGVASIQGGCNMDAISNTKDWSYCPKTGELHAIIPDYPPAKGNP